MMIHIRRVKIQKEKRKCLKKTTVLQFTLVYQVARYDFVAICLFTLFHTNPTTNLKTNPSMN
jgi:hypothetical protein